MAIEKSAGVLLYRMPLQFLLLHYPAGHWDFPKGKLEKGETEQQAALREVREETGITRVRLLPGFRESVQYYFRQDGKTIRKTVVYFLGETDQHEVQISFEHQGFLWLAPPEALRQVTFHNARSLLQKALIHLQRRGVAPAR
ncbi:MAG: NUDIX domain-containing protein [Candidatus Aenigmarchaeota archaeon]|nr:NUDIX domain-containing protein [Candidatus Aenigmarchaeota archaeon]